MKTLLALMLMLLSFASAAREVSSIGGYVDDVLGAKEGSGARCYVSSSPTRPRGCRMSDVPSSRPRVFGAFLLDGVSRGYLFIIQRTSSGFSVEESNRFSTEGVWGLDEMGADSDDRFHINFQHGSASTPTHDVYRFKLIGGQWRVVGRDHSTMEYCSDGGIGSGTKYSANYLTGKVVATIRKDCKYIRMKVHRVRFPPFHWETFDPFDEELAPEHYGLTW